MICLDSDFLIDLLRNKQSAINKVKELTKRDQILVTTSITVMELFLGISALDGVASKRIEQTRTLVNSLTILNFDSRAAERSAYIYNTLKKLGTPIGVKDTLIAGIAIEHGTILLTRNIKHFERVSGLRLESW